MIADKLLPLYPYCFELTEKNRIENYISLYKLIN